MHFIWISGYFFNLQAHQTLALREGIRYPLPYHPELYQGTKQLQFQVDLANTSVEDFPEAKLAFDDQKGMLHYGAEEGFRRLNQNQKPALWCLWKHSALGWRPSDWCKSPGPQPGVAGLSVRTSGDRLNG